jgi:hypothetical protein
MKTATIALATVFMFGSIAAASAQGGRGAGGGDSPTATTGQDASSSPSAVDPGATQNDPKEREGTTSAGGTMMKDKTSKDNVKK